MLESHAKAQRRKGRKPGSFARSSTSKIHYRQLGSSISVPSASISGPVLAVWLCGLLLGELGALARNLLLVVLIGAGDA